jgi:hypothetical protein
MPPYYFLSEDDANRWYKKTVSPYRQTWENRKKMKKRCKDCGNELQEEWKLCPFCGRQINEQANEAWPGSGTVKAPLPTPQPVPDGLAFKIVKDKSVTITKYSGLADAVSIPERIKDLPVTDIGNGAFNCCRTLYSVTIPFSVTSIGSSAFCDCDRLTSIAIPSSVRTIGSYAFNRCKRLKSVTIASSVRSIGSYAFLDCRSLTSVTIPSSVITIGQYAFKGCKSMNGVSLSRLTEVGEGAFPFFAWKTYSD